MTLDTETYSTLPEESSPNLDGQFVDRLRSFDKFLGLFSTDLEDLLVEDNDKSLLDLNESCLVTVNTSLMGVPSVPQKHDGILEQILERPAPKSKSPRRSTSPMPETGRGRSRLPAILKLLPGISGNMTESIPDQVPQLEDSDGALFGIGEEKVQYHHKEGQSGSQKVDSKNTPSNKSPIRRKRHPKTEEHSATSTTKKGQSSTKAVLTSDKESRRMLKGSLSPKPRRVTSKGCDENQLSVSMHSERSTNRGMKGGSKRYTRQDLYGATARRPDTVRRATSHPNQLWTSQSEHIPTSGDRNTNALLGARCASTNKLLHEGDSPCRSKSCDKHKKSQHRSAGSKRQMKRSSSDCRISESHKLEIQFRTGNEDEPTRDDLKNQTCISPCGSRPRQHLSRVSARGSPSSYSHRRLRTSSNTRGTIMQEEELVVAGRHSPSMRRNDDHAPPSSRDSCPLSTRRRVKSLTPADTFKRIEKEEVKRMESVNSFFGNNGGSGIMISPGLPLKRQINAEEFLTSIPSAPRLDNKETLSNPTVVSSLLLDLRRQTGQHMMQKFKPSRNLKAGIMDDIRQ